MGKVIRTILFILFLAIFSGVGAAQTRIDSLSVKLDSLSTHIKGLNHNIDLSVSNLPLKEFIRNVANLTQLNIDMDDDLNQTVTNNFVGVPTKDVLLFLSKVYSLDFNFTGSIIHIRKHVEKAPRYIPKKVKVYYDSTDRLLTLDLKNDSLYRVARKITGLTHKNIIFSKETGWRKISGYILNQDLKSALENLALSNNLSVGDAEGAYVLEADDAKNGNNRRTSSRNRSNVRGEFKYKVHSKEHLDIYGLKVDVGQVIELISKKLHINYFIDSEIKATTNLNLINVSYDEFLSDILQRTAYTFKVENGIYFVGKRDAEGLRETKVIQLMNRSVTKLSEIIPESIKKEVSIKEFSDLNSFVVSGSSRTIAELEMFIRQIDKVVPLILIEVLIVDNQSSYTVSTGIDAGITNEPIKSGGTLFSGIDFALNSNSINKLLNSFNGLGVVNLGKVNPNFYLTIKALEDEGIIKVRSTPKLSTLNGQEAKLTIGNTEYYLEKRTDFIINQTTQERTTSQYKAVNADFKITILPIVSGNEEITLKITVDQSDFTSRISTEAPPGQIFRNFTSSVRVKNKEMILLGGLEEKTGKETNKGFPLLSRIPILKWIFSNKTKEKSVNKLNIFVKPTVIY